MKVGMPDKDRKSSKFHSSSSTVVNWEISQVGQLYPSVCCLAANIALR